MAYYDTSVFAPRRDLENDDLAGLALGSPPMPGDGGKFRRMVAAGAGRMQRLQFVYRRSAAGADHASPARRGHFGHWDGSAVAGRPLRIRHDDSAVVLTNADDAAPGPFARRALDLVGKALDASAPPPAENQPDPAWSAYFGTYTDPWGWEIEVLTLDGDLVLYEHGYPPDDEPGAPLNRLAPVPGEPHTFTMGDGERVRFEIGEDGTVRRMQRRYDYFTPVR
jgi:hypothetical protein